MRSSPTVNNAVIHWLVFCSAGRWITQIMVIIQSRYCLLLLSAHHLKSDISNQCIWIGKYTQHTIQETSWACFSLEFTDSPLSCISSSLSWTSTSWAGIYQASERSFQILWPNATKWTLKIGPAYNKLRRSECGVLVRHNPCHDKTCDCIHYDDHLKHEQIPWIACYTNDCHYDFDQKAVA